MLVITNIVSAVVAKTTQIADQFKKILITQLINGISRVFEKFIKHIDGTALSTSSVLAPARSTSFYFFFRLKGFRMCYIIIWLILVIFP